MTTADGLRLAATYCASYIRHATDQARMQRVLLRFAADAVLALMAAQPARKMAYNASRPHKHGRAY